MKHIFYVCILCTLSNSVEAMYKKKESSKKNTAEQERLKKACVKTAGKSGPTPFDNALQQELELMKTTNPEKYKRLISAAQKREAFANNKTSK